MSPLPTPLPLEPNDSITVMALTSVIHKGLDLDLQRALRYSHFKGGFCGG